jgi:hypothetical protein
LAGYSGTPLAKKLGIKPNFRVALPHLPPDVHKELRTALADCEIESAGRVPLDLVVNFVTGERELRQSFAGWSRKLAPAGMLWIAWPKKSSGVKTDLNENKIREIGLAAGLVDVKVCAIDQVWSGLKFVIRVGDRLHGPK